MRWWWIFAGLALVLPAAAGATELQTYGQLPSLDNLAVSPDGTLLAYSTDVDGKRTVLIVGLADKKIVAAIAGGDQKLRDLTWADNDHLLITVSVTRVATGVIGARSEYTMTSSFGITDHKQRGLLERIGDSMNIVIGMPRRRVVDGRQVVFLEGITFPNTRGMLALFSVDIESGRAQLVQTGTKNTEDWYLDGAGNVVARSQYDEDTRRWSLEARNGSNWDEFYSVVSPIDNPWVSGMPPAGNALIVNVPEGNGYRERQYNLTDKRWESAVDFGDDVTRTIEDPVSHRIIGSEQLFSGTTYKFFDPADQAAWNSVAAAFPDENVELVSWSDDRKKIVVRVDGPRDGAVYDLVDMNTHHAIVLGPVYRGVDASAVATVKRIRYAAADGRMILAYLTLPNGRPAKDLPLIVLPHGGPGARDMPEFDWWSQALASRGYAVLQPEFRGSAGFGRGLETAGYGEWGRKMQTDLSDGVRFLAGDGTIDAKRVCIAGASYGGYAALAGATLDPGVYRCAVSVSGVSDPQGFLQWRAHRQHASDSQALRYWARYMGAADMDDPKLKDISPLAHAANAAIPILLIHGKDDTVVPIQQSIDMERALKDAGKTVTFITLDGEDHWLSRSETRLKMLEATVEFLEANNPPN